VVNTPWVCEITGRVVTVNAEKLKKVSSYLGFVPSKPKNTQTIKNYVILDVQVAETCTEYC
jgi:hypothetical protein